MKLLALETSTELCSVALWQDGAIAARQQHAGREHTQLLLPMAQELLANAALNWKALDALAFGRGPGGFTGLRIAAGVAQGLGLALNRPLLPVSTLAALALQALRRHRAQRVLAALDARLGELYWNCHVFDGRSELADAGEEQLSAAAAVRPPEGEWFGIGSGWLKHAEVLRRSGTIVGADPGALPLAEDIVRIAAAEWSRNAKAALPADQAAPIYLRNRVTMSG